MEKQAWIIHEFYLRRQMAALRWQRNKRRHSCVTTGQSFFIHDMRWMICLNKIFLDAVEESWEAEQIRPTSQRFVSQFAIVPWLTLLCRWLWRHYTQCCNGNGCGGRHLFFDISSGGKGPPPHPWKCCSIKIARASLPIVNNISTWYSIVNYLRINYWNCFEECYDSRIGRSAVGHGHVRGRVSK